METDSFFLGRKKPQRSPGMETKKGTLTPEKLPSLTERSLTHHHFPFSRGYGVYTFKTPSYTFMTFSSHFLRVPKCFHGFLFPQSHPSVLLCTKHPHSFQNKHGPFPYNIGLKNQTKGIHCVFFWKQNIRNISSKIAAVVLTPIYSLSFLEHTSWSNVERWGASTYLQFP